MSEKTAFHYFAVFFLLFACASATAEKNQQPNMLPPFQHVLEAAGFNLQPLNLQWPLLEQFYTNRHGQSVWHGDGRLNPFASSLLDWISSVRREGLSPADYHLETLRFFSPYTLGNTQQLRELILTDAFFRLVSDLRTGRFNPKEIDPEWRLPTETFDPALFLEALLQEGSFAQLFDRLTPTTQAYARLRDAYRQYLEIELAGGWPRISVNYVLRPGVSDPVVTLLRERLKIEGDHPGTDADDPWHYDDQLKEAVKRFQRRNGLVEDGFVGPITRSVLNVSVAGRIKQLLANMERWRWLPRDLGINHLLVNTAGYELTLVSNGESVFHKRTITGRQGRQTPSFKSRITHLVVNPEWTVPRIIAVEDLLPKQQMDVGFLDQRGIRVLQKQEGHWVQLDAKALDWGQYHKDNFPFLLRQASGPKNSLGRIKFHMNNPYAIFLHDTPSVSLFNKPIRAFSSGCVRVQDADQLARFLLDAGGQSSEELIDLPLQSGDTQITKLSTPVEVYLVYFTSWVDEAGAVQFRPDIYQRNTNLILALQEHTREMTAPQQKISAKSF